MEFDTLMSFITTIGFPIAMCLLIFWRMGQESESHREEVKSLQETIRENAVILKENTVILSQLKQIIEDKL